MRTTSERRAAVILAALALALAACGGDDEPTTDPAPAEPTEDADPPEDAEPEEPAEEPAEEPEEPEESADAPDEAADPADPAADADTVEVTLQDYAYVGLPATVAAGTTLSVVNASEAELHELVAMRLPDDEERSVEELVQLPQEEFDAVGEAIGMPTTVLLAAPGGEQIDAVGDGSLTEPGRYALMCFIPTGADPEEFLAGAQEEDAEGPPEVEGGPPHFINGMYAELLVE